MYDMIVIGGGPAGMTAALYALRNGKTVLVRRNMADRSRDRIKRRPEDNPAPADHTCRQCGKDAAGTALRANSGIVVPAIVCTPGPEGRSLVQGWTNFGARTAPDAGGLVQRGDTESKNVRMQTNGTARTDRCACGTPEARGDGFDGRNGIHKRLLRK